MSNKVINSKDIDLAAVMMDGVAAVFLLPPMATFAVSSVRSITQLNEEEFIEKLQLFLKESNTSEEDKTKLLNFLNKDVDSFFKRLFKVLDRLEDKQKASIIGKLFNGLCRERINTVEFRKLCSVVDTLYIGSIEFLDFEFRRALVHLKEEYQIEFKEHDARNYITEAEKKIECQPLINAQLISERIEIVEKRNKNLSTERPKQIQQIRYELEDLGTKLILYGIMDYQGELFPPYSNPLPSGLTT